MPERKRAGENLTTATSAIDVLERLIETEAQKPDPDRRKVQQQLTAVVVALHNDESLNSYPRRIDPQIFSSQVLGILRSQLEELVYQPDNVGVRDWIVFINLVQLFDIDNPFDISGRSAEVKIDQLEQLVKLRDRFQDRLEEIDHDLTEVLYGYLNRCIKQSLFAELNHIPVSQDSLGRMDSYVNQLLRYHQLLAAVAASENERAQLAGVVRALGVIGQYLDNLRDEEYINDANRIDLYVEKLIAYLQSLLPTNFSEVELAARLFENMSASGFRVDVFSILSALITNLENYTTVLSRFPQVEPNELQIYLREMSRESFLPRIVKTSLVAVRARNQQLVDLLKSLAKLEKYDLLPELVEQELAQVEQYLDSKSVQAVRRQIQSARTEFTQRDQLLAEIEQLVEDESKWDILMLKYGQDKRFLRRIMRRLQSYIKDLMTAPRGDQALTNHRLKSFYDRLGAQLQTMDREEIVSFEDFIQVAKEEKTRTLAILKENSALGALEAEFSLVSDQAFAANWEGLSRSLPAFVEAARDIIPSSMGFSAIMKVWLEDRFYEEITSRAGEDNFSSVEELSFYLSLFEFDFVVLEDYLPRMAERNQLFGFSEVRYLRAWLENRKIFNQFVQTKCEALLSLSTSLPPVDSKLTELDTLSHFLSVLKGVTNAKSEDRLVLLETSLSGQLQQTLPRMVETLESNEVSVQAIFEALQSKPYLCRYPFVQEQVQLYKRVREQLNPSFVEKIEAISRDDDQEIDWNSIYRQVLKDADAELWFSVVNLGEAKELKGLVGALERHQQALQALEDRTSRIWDLAQLSSIDASESPVQTLTEIIANIRVEWIEIYLEASRLEQRLFDNLKNSFPLTRQVVKAGISVGIVEQEKSRGRLEPISTQRLFEEHVVGQLPELEAEHGRLIERLSRLYKSLRQLETLEVEAKQKIAEIEAAQSAVASYEEALAELTAKRTELREEIGIVTANVQTASEELNSLRTTQVDLDRERDEIVDDVLRLKERVEKAEKAVVQKRAKLKQLTERLDTLVAQTTSAKAKVEKAATSLEQVRARQARVEKYLRGEESQLESLSAERATILAKMAEVKDNLRTIEEQLTRAREATAAKQEELAALIAAIPALTARERVIKRVKAAQEEFGLEVHRVRLDEEMIVGGQGLLGDSVDFVSIKREGLKNQSKWHIIQSAPFSAITDTEEILERNDIITLTTDDEQPFLLAGTREPLSQINAEDRNYDPPTLTPVLFAVTDQGLWVLELQPQTQSREPAVIVDEQLEQRLGINTPLLYKRLEFNNQISWAEFLAANETIEDYQIAKAWLVVPESEQSD